jgi:hypothetical protein
MRPAIRIIFAPLFLREKKIREAGGFIHGRAQNRTIELDPRSSSILDTLVHELTHIDHPSWSEAEVRAHTKKRMTKMGWKEKARLLKLLGSAIIEGED